MTWRPLPGGPGPEPRPVSASRDAVTTGLGGPAAAVLAAVFGRWPEIVGPAVAERCRPMAVVNGTLVVAVEDPAGASQLRYAASGVLERVRQVVGPGVAERVEVRVRPAGDRRPSRSDGRLTSLQFRR